MIFTGNDASGEKDQTVRVHIANPDWVRKNPDLARRCCGLWGRGT